MLTQRHALRLAAGILVTAVFAYLSLRGVQFAEAGRALAHARYGYILLAAGLLLLSHYLRALRWRYLLAPVVAANTGSLFSALAIGYAANTFVPAHLGEVLRAYVVGKKRGVPSSAAFASIVVERIVDVVSLIAVMALVVGLHPFPGWVVQSGYAMLGGALLLLGALIGLKRFGSAAAAILHRILSPLPAPLGRRLETLVLDFCSGIMPLKSAWHYLGVGVLSVAIWVCYALSNYACLKAFHLVTGHDLPWYAALVVLVVTTISVVIPSTPGYVGTYHYLCQVALVMFGVSTSEALSFAVVSHLVNLLPVTLLGLALANYEGVSVLRAASAPPG